MVPTSTGYIQRLSRAEPTPKKWPMLVGAGRCLPRPISVGFLYANESLIYLIWIVMQHVTVHYYSNYNKVVIPKIQ